MKTKIVLCFLIIATLLFSKANAQCPVVAASTDNQTIAGTDSWVGHAYDGMNFNTYMGQFTESETFSENFGSSNGCFNITSGGVPRSIHTETFSARFRMNSTKKGLYVANLGSDDGARLSVDGSLIYNNWSDHSFATNASVLMNLNGSSSLVYEYYENADANQVIFQNFNRLISNTLTNNITQTLCVGNNGATISGDVFTGLPSGISLSGTGYQWTYSTTPGGTRINIAGATAATFTPSTLVAPFNVPGTYYVYRIAKLSSSNNVSPTTYVASNESNAAVIIHPSASADDAMAAGNDSWIGHMYDGTNFATYLGQFNEAETFTQNFGGAATCFNVTAAGNTRSIYTESFSVKYRMNSTKKGLYVVNLGSDDGARLTLDGTMIFNNWTDHSFNVNSNVLMNLTGSSNLMYEFYENAGDNQVIFQNFVPVVSNTLASNTTQSICAGNSGATISGDVFGSLPSGIILSGTGYQWVYSTTPGGARINITGATGATFTPSTATAPFNTAGTYYVYRIAKLTSTNNINPLFYTASNESNAAVIVINGGAQWTGAISTDWAVAGNWCAGVVPTSATDVTIKASAVRMPEIITTGSCRNLTIETGATVAGLAGSTFNIAATLTNNGTMTNNGTVNFNGTAQQTFSGVNSFYNLTTSNAAGVLLPSAITVNNNLLIASGVLNANNYFITVRGNWTNNASATAFTAGTGTVVFAGSAAQLVNGSFSTRFNNFTSSNTADAVTLGVNATILNNLSVTSGILDLGIYTANRLTSGGTLMVANNAILEIGGTQTFPSNYTSNTLVVNSTVEYNGTNQTVANQLYGNLMLSSSAGTVTKTFPATALSIAGNLISVKGPGTAVNFTAASNITVSRDVSIGAATTFNGGSFSHAIAGDWANEGTFTGNTSTVTFTGTGATISGAGAHNFNDLTIAASGISFTDNNLNLTGNLATTGSGNFNAPAGSTLTMSGTSKTITGIGYVLGNVNITGSVSTASTIEIAGNLSSTNLFSANTASITMTGAGKTIGGAGGKAIGTLNITGSVTTNAGFSIYSALNVSGSFTASAGVASFYNTSTLTGTANLFDVTATTASTLRLTSGSVLGVAGVLTTTGATLDVTSSTPNTVDFNGAATLQVMNGITYDNLKISNGNTKYPASAITVNNNITIATGTTFRPDAHVHTVKGDWYNYGAFTTGSSHIQFTGAKNKHIYGATTFSTLTVNNSSASVTINLHNSIEATNATMTQGTMLTGADTITITSSRTGNGIILGNITRKHSFGTGVDYAFEGPDNTIRFTLLIGVINSITVTVKQISIADFPSNNAISREYSINVPGVIYTANLRLHYEDAELNGNVEANMNLWNESGLGWMYSGKNSNSTTANYVQKDGLLNVGGRWTLAAGANGVYWNGSVSNDWNTANNWTVLSGSPTRPPSANDIAEIGVVNFNHQPIISTAVNVKNIVLGSTKAVTLSMNAGGSLSTGDISGKWTGSSTHTLNVNNQTVNIGGNFVLSDGTAGRAINVNIGTGNLNVAGALRQLGGANINFSAAGNLSLKSDFERTSGNFTPGTGTVTYDGSVNQGVAAVNYYNLTINKTSSEALIEDSTNVAGNLSVNAGSLRTTASTVVAENVNIVSGASFDNNSRLRVGGNWNNAGTYTSSAVGSNVIFNGSGTQNISATTFYDIEINKPVGSIAQLTGDVTLKGNLWGTSGTLDIKTFLFNRDNVGGTANISNAGTLIIGANNAPNKFSSYTLGTSSTVIFNGTATQHLALPGLIYGNVIFRNAGTKILYTTINVKGDLTIDNGATLDGAASTITLEGNWINNAVFLPGTSELIVAGNLKTISGNNTFNRLTVPGSYTMLNNNTINSLLRITSTGNINGGAGIVTTMNGDLINNGILYTLGTTTFTGNVQQTLSLINAVQTVAVTVNFNGTVPPVLNSTTPPQYGYLNINNTGGVTASVGYTIVNGLSVGLGATFNAGNSTHNIYGYLSNNGNINSSGTINFLPATATNIGMGVDFTSTGRVVFGGAGAIALTGAPSSLRNVTVSNINAAGVTASSNWILTNTLTVNSGSIFKAGSNQLSIAGNIDNRGTINSGSSTFIMNGTAPQTIYSASALNNLTINNANSPVTLLTDVWVAGTLDFVKGNINTENYKLVQTDAGIIINASQTTGWVNGNLKKGIANGATVRIFQTGDANYYTPVTLNLQSVTTAGNLTVNSIAGDHPSLSTSSININKSVNRYWKLLNEGIVFTSVEAAFKHPFSDVDASANTSAFGAAAYNGATWANKATVSSNDSITKITSNVLTGDFAIGEICYSNTTIAYASTYYCTSAPAATPVLTGTAGGTFSSHPGLVINATTGRITPATSAAGEYVVTYSFAATGECAAYSTSTTVFITQAPSASIAYPGGPYCQGVGTAVAVLTGTTGGIFSADNGLHIDPLSGTIDLNNNEAGNYTITYTITAAGGCATAAYTAGISIVSPGKWTGTVSTQWYEAGNWLCGIIPAATANVRLDAGAAHYPVIDTGNVMLNNLTVANGASLKVEHARLKVAGAISNLGAIDLSKGTLEFEGNTPQTVAANTFINNAVEKLIISNKSDSGLVLAAPLDVYESLTYTTNGKNIISNDFLTLKSTAAGTARVGNMTGKTVTGNVSVENYIPARKAWYFLAVPTNTANNIQQSWQEGAVNAAGNPVPGFGTQITSPLANWQAAGFDNYSVGVSVKKYNQVSNNWVGISATNASPIKSVDGYMIYIRGDRTVYASTPNATPTVLRTKGPLYTGNLAPVPVAARKTVSVGNPFAAPLDMRKIAKTGVKDFFYVWDPKLGGAYGNGAYQVFSPDSLGNYVVVPGGGSYGANGSVSNYIASGLAFFVEGDSTGGYISFDENAKYDPADAVVSQGGRSKLIVGLDAVAADKSALPVDGLMVNFDAAYSNKIDKGDAAKYLNAGENISVLVSNQSLVVERRNLSASTDTIYFKVTNLKAQQYKLNLNASQLDAGGRAGRLIDNFTGTNTPLSLNGNTAVEFTVSAAAASYASNRFKIVFDKFSVLPVKFVSLKAYTAAGTSNNVEWQTAEEINTKNYEVERSHDGASFVKIATVAAKGNTGAAYSFNDAQPFADVNYYRIKGIENSGQVVYSNIVKIATANKEAVLNVFPNPVTDGVTSLQLNNMPKGSYAVSLIAISGQVVYNTTLQNTGRSTTNTLDFGKTIAAGIYQLLTVDPNGVKHNREIIIK